jgi:hypothetical protein
MGINHFVQVMGRVFNVEVFVLARPAFRGNDAAAVDVLKVSVGELVSPFGILGALVINSQIPFTVCFHPMSLDEVIFLLCGRPVFAPCISLVKDKPSAADQIFRMIECPPVQLYGHGCDSHAGRRASRVSRGAAASLALNESRRALTIVNFQIFLVGGQEGCSALSCGERPNSC